MNSLNVLAYECKKINNVITMETVRVLGEKGDCYKVFDTRCVKYVKKWNIITKENYDEEQVKND